MNVPYSPSVAIFLIAYVVDWVLDVMVGWFSFGIFESLVPNVTVVPRLDWIAHTSASTVPSVIVTVPSLTTIPVCP